MNQAGEAGTRPLELIPLEQFPLECTVIIDENPPPTPPLQKGGEPERRRLPPFFQGGIKEFPFPTPKSTATSNRNPLFFVATFANQIDCPLHDAETVADFVLYDFGTL